MPRGKADRAGIAGDVVQAQHLRLADHDAENSPAHRHVTDLPGLILVDPGREKALERLARGRDHAESRVARAREVGGSLDQPLQHGVERELGGQQDPGLDEPPKPFPLVDHGCIICRTRRGALSVTPEVPSCRTPAVGRSRQEVRELVQGVIAAEMGDDELRAVRELDDEAPASGNSLGLRPTDPHLRDVLEANPTRPPTVDG